MRQSTVGALAVAGSILSCQISLAIGGVPAQKLKIEPGYSLSGDLVKGGVWELRIYCSHEGTPREAIYGELWVDGKEMKSAEAGEMIEAKLGNLKYFEPGKGKSKVTGWYFFGWPQECAYLPK